MIGVFVIVFMFKSLCVVIEGVMICVWLFMFISSGLIFSLFVFSFSVFCMFEVVLVLLKISMFVVFFSWECGIKCLCILGFSVVLICILLLNMKFMLCVCRIFSVVCILWFDVVFRLLNCEWLYSVIFGMMLKWWIWCVVLMVVIVICFGLGL